MVHIITSSKTPLISFRPARKLFDLMQLDFAFSIKNRLVVIPEVDKYKIKEDSSIFDQVKKEKYEYEVYFDGEYVSGFNTTENPLVARINVLKGLKRLYSEGKIHWNQKQYELDKMVAKEAEKAKKQKRESKRKKLKTKEEKLVEIGIRKALKIDKK